MALRPKAAPAAGANGRIISDNLSFENSDFTEDVKVKEQANVMLFADAGMGKTTFATKFAPDPVVLINFDGRARHAVKAAQSDGRRIRLLEIASPLAMPGLSEESYKSVAKEAVDKVVRNYQIAIAESLRGNCRTICIDTATEYAEILTLAIRGHLGKGQDYGRSKDLINRELWRLFNMAREGHAHLVVLARARPVWVDNEPTGNFTFRGPDVLNDGPDWCAQIRLKKTKKGKLQKEFEIEITKSGVNIDELGKVYTQEDWEDFGGPFVFTCMNQYQTGPSDWE